MNLQSILASQWFLLLSALTALISTGVVFLWSKRPWRWILAIASVALVIAAGYFWSRVPDLDPQLPGEFQKPFFMPWILFFALGLLYALTHFVWTIIRLSSPRSTPIPGAGTFPEIDAAWHDILIQLSQARITPSSLYFLLAPAEDLAASVVDSAGLQLFVKAPAAPESPIHCYAIADGIYLSIAGCSVLGRQDAEGTARLEYLCRLIAAENPEQPILRGIATLIPFEWASDANSLRQVSAVRDDIQTIRRAFKVRCPTLTVFCLRDSLPGFNEFASRLPPRLRHNRCGFSVPVTIAQGNEVFRQGTLWMSQWFQSWSLNLMVQEVHNKDGNNRLLSMIVAFRRAKNPLSRLLDSALTMHSQAEPVFFRGCYFVACGPTSDKQAFAAGLLNGAKSKLLADHVLAAWSREADQFDRRYRLGAWALGIGTAAVVLPIWFFRILERLAHTQHASPKIGWTVLVLLVVMWVAKLVSMRFRRTNGRPQAVPKT